jgi:predicted RNase H-like HicB family nuclease
MKYTVILQRETDGGYVVTAPALPGCVSQGDSRQEALRNIEEAVELYREDMPAAGEPIPIEDGLEYVEVPARATSPSYPPTFLVGILCKRCKELASLSKDNEVVSLSLAEKRLMLV